VQLELTVPVYNISEGNNAEILSHSKALSDYSAFVTIVGGYEAGGLPRVEAIEKAVYECAKGGIMETYLRLRGSEVRNMLITEWDNDEAVEVAREEGVEEGIERGRGEERVETAARMKADGMDIALIAKYTGLAI
jgi:predicted transposase/invertase (TIGR01784 family)